MDDQLLPEKIGGPEEMHEFALFFADLYQRHFHKVRPERGSDVDSAALTAITHDAVIAHQGAGLLVFNGWSSAAAPVVRSMVDLTVSALAIVNSASPQLAAFKYLHAGYRTFERDIGYSREGRAGARQLLRSRVERLRPEDRPTAVAYLRGRNRPYWFADEWRTPSEVLDAFGSEDMKWRYGQLSSAAHGGFLGVRTWRDRPFEMNINARLPIGRSAAVLALQSSRMLIELVCLRAEYDGTGFRPVCDTARGYFEKIAMPERVV